MNRPARQAPAPIALQDAKARFSAVVDAAMRGEAQLVTRRGKAAVVIVAAAEFDRLSRHDRSAAPGFIDFLRSMPYDEGHAKALEQRPKIRPRDIDFGS